MARRRMRWVALALATLVVFAVPARLEADPSSGPRLALVIGNGAYAGANRLATATADAGLIAGALAQDGFDVTAMGDVDAETLRKTVSLFVEKAREAGPFATLFVYLSGHGLQYSGANYFVPVGARIARQVDVPATSVPLTEITDALGQVPARARFYVFDLARANGFADGDALPLSSGLIPVTPKDGSLYAFNAAPGSVGGREVAPYGLYARALAEMLRTPGLPVEQLFRRVRLRATEMSGGAIVPWDDGAGLDDVVLLSTASGQPVPRTVEERVLADAAASELYWAAVARDRLDGYRTFVQTFPDDKQAARIRDVIAIRLEALTWAAAVRVDSPPAYWTYMHRFPRGPHYVDVRRRLAALHAGLEPPPRYEIYQFDGLPPPTAEQVAVVTRPDIAADNVEWPQVPPPPNGLLPPPPDAFTIGLPPPPLVPDGVLPAPAALPPVEVAAVERSGRIVQPFVSGKGRVSIEYRPPPAPMILSAEGVVISRTATTTTRTQRTILQTDPADRVLSRTVTEWTGGATTTIQTGPGGGIISKMTTRDDAGGMRTTTIVDGANRLVAEVKTNPRGVVIGVRRGETPHADETFGLVTPRQDGSRPNTARPAAPAPPPVGAAPDAVKASTPAAAPAPLKPASPGGKDLSPGPTRSSRDSQNPASPADGPAIGTRDNSESAAKWARAPAAALPLERSAPKPPPAPAPVAKPVEPTKSATPAEAASVAKPSLPTKRERPGADPPAAAAPSPSNSPPDNVSEASPPPPTLPRPVPRPSFGRAKAATRALQRKPGRATARQHSRGR